MVNVIIEGKEGQGMSCASIQLGELLHKLGYKIYDLYDNKNEEFKEAKDKNGKSK